MTLIPGPRIAPDMPVTTSTSNGVPLYGSGDLLPFVSRAIALSVSRLMVLLSIVLGAVLTDVGLPAMQWLLSVGYVAAAGTLSVLMGLLRHRQAAIAVLGLCLCLDGVGLQFLHHQLGAPEVTNLAIAAFLVAGCLLGSFRTGLKLVIWQTILILLDDQGTASGLFGPGPARPDPAPLIAMLWALVLLVCFAASISERELRRRRYDSELLRDFAVGLNQDDDPDRVLARTLTFTQDELNAGRTVICSDSGAGLTLLAGAGIGAVPPSASTRESLLLGLALRRPALARRLDPEADAWLEAVLPEARRVIAVLIGRSVEGSPMWLVMEHRAQGIRLERRVLATVGQMAATTALALSRAVLFQQVHRQATIDALTGLPNRRTFDQHLAAATEVMPAVSGAVILADVDRFKSINDTHGHQAGDTVLQAVAQALRTAAPEEALVARYGGEEFVVFLPSADDRRALDVAESLRIAVAESAGPWPVTASFGVALLAEHTSATQSLAAADAGLYAAKSGGRNQVGRQRVDAQVLAQVERAPDLPT